MGFSANSLGRLNIEIGYTVDKSGLNQIQNSLSDLMIKSKMFGSNLDTGMKQAAISAKQLTGLLAASMDPKTGALNVGQLATSFKMAGVSLSGLRTNLSQAGAEGQQAFASLNKQLLSAQTTVTKTEGVVGQLGKTFVNTFMYSFSYRIVGTFIKGVSDAVNYVKDLDKALTDIRIVTKESTEEMNRFAEKANDAAKNLGVSTKAYAEAALIFTQQGLKGKERDIKTETTMKVANVTGDDAAEVSQNLTAVWNGYKVASEDAEAAIDKLANVAAHSASNLAELSTGMSKVASAANTMGVSEDQLVAQLSTIESVTRQAPESIGTALKTIYARMGDLKVKGTDEFGVSLGEVSSKLKTMGVDILDQEGNMKDMGQVMEEVAAKWNTWTDAQRQAAAVSMAGKRQYNNLISLFSNWDMYEQNLEYSENSEGQIEAQQQIYLESIEGLQGKAKAAWEAVYSQMFDSSTFKGFYEVIAGIGDAFSSIGDFLPIGTFIAIANIFKSQLVPGISNFVLGLNKAGVQSAILETQQQAINQAYKTTVQIGGEQVFTNQEILNAAQQYSLQLRAQEGETVQLSRENVALAESTKVRLAIQEGLTEEQQLHFQSLQQQEAEQEKLLSQEIMQYGERAQLLGLSKEELQLSDENTLAIGQMSEAYLQNVPIIIEILNASREIYSLVQGNMPAAIKFIRQLLTEQSVTIKETDVDISSIIQNETQRIAIIEQIKTLMNQCKGDTDIMDEKTKELTLDLDAASSKVANIGTKMNGAATGMADMTQQAGTVMALSATFMGLTNGVFALSMAVMSLKSIWSSFNDEEASVGERTTALLMGFGMLLMTLRQGYQAFKSIRSVLGTYTIALDALNTTQGVAAARLSHKQILMLKENETALRSIIITKGLEGAKLNEIKADMVAFLVKQNVDEARAAEIVEMMLEQGMLKKLIPLKIREIFLDKISTLWKNKWALAIIAAVAVLAILAITIANTTTKQQEHLETLQESQKQAYETGEALKEMTDKYEDLKSSLSELKEEYATLETLKNGTEEWDEQVLKINSHIADLINQYPKLAMGMYVDDDGVFRISQGAIDKTRASMYAGIESQQQQLFQQQAQVKEDKKVTIADDMSDIVEDFDTKLAVNDEFSTDMLSAIEDSTVHTVSDLQNALQQKGITVDQGQAASLFSLLQEARNQDFQKIALLKQSAAIARKNSGLRLQGKGETEEAREENQKTKEDVYDTWFANAKAEQLEQIRAARDNLSYWNYKGAGEVSRPMQITESALKTLGMSTTGPLGYLGMAIDSISGSDIIGWGKTASETYFTDRLVKGGSLSKKKVDDAVLKIQAPIPDYLPQVTAKDLGISRYSDFDILHLAAQAHGLEREQVKWTKEGVVKIGDEDTPLDGFKLTETEALTKVEDELYARVFETALNKFMEEDLDITNLTTKLGRLSSKYKYRKNEKSDYDNVNISDIHKGDWDVSKEQSEINDRIAELGLEPKKNAAEIKRLQGQLKLLDNESKSVGAAIEEKVYGTIANEGIYDKWNKSVQTAFDTGNISVSEGQDITRMIDQVRANGIEKIKENEATNIEKAYEKIAKTDGGYDVSDFTQALKSIDWSKTKSIDDIKTSFETYGVEVDKLDVNWKKIAEEAKRITTQTADLAGNLEQFNQTGTTFLSLIKGLKAGDTISKEDYESILSDAADQETIKRIFSFDANKKRYIYTGTDGTGQPDTSKSAIRKAMFGEGIEGAISSAKQITTNFNSNKKGAIDLADSSWDALDFKDEKKRKPSYHTDVHTAAHDLILDAYNQGEGGGTSEAFKLLTTVGGKDRTDLVTKIAKGEAWSKDKGIDSDYQDDFKEWLKAVRKMRSGIIANAFDPEAVGVLSSALQSESSGAADLFSNINVYAKDASGKGRYNEEQKQNEGLEAITAQAATAAEALGGTVQEETAFTESLSNANPKLEEHSELLAKTAGSASYNLMKGVEKLSTLFTDTYKDAQKGTTQYAQMLQDVAETANTALGVEGIDSEFVDKHISQFRRMAKGDKAAIKEIQRELIRTKGLTSFGISFKGLKTTQNQFWGMVKSLQDAKVSIDTNLNTKKVFLQLAETIAKMQGMTVGQMNDFFSNLGVTLEWEDDVASTTKTSVKKDGGVKGLKGAFKLHDKGLNLAGAAQAGEKDSNKGNNSGNKPNYTYEQIDKNDIDHLHDLKQAMEDLNSTLSKLKNEQDKVFGKSLIANLNKQNKLIEKQNKNLKDQIKIQTKDLGQSQTDMRKLFGFRFNKKTGRISNYKKVLNERYHAYKEYLEKYNKLSAKQQDAKKGKTLKAKADKAKTQWTEAKTAVSDYDTLFNERQQNIDKTIENFNTIAENNIKKLHAMAEALELTTQLQETYLNYQKDINHDSKDRAYQSAYNVETAKLEQKKAKENLKETQALNKELTKMTKTGWSKKYGTNFKVLTEALAKSQKALVENIKKAQDSLISNIQLLTDNYKDFNEEVERTNKIYKHLISTLETYNEITKMLYGDDEYDVQSEVALEKVDLYKGQTEVAKRNFEEAQQYLSNAEQAYKDALDSGSKEGILKAKETLDAAKEAVNSAEEALNEAVKNQIKSLQEWYTAQIKEFFKDLEKATTGGYGWDFLSTSIKRAKQYSDDWLDDIQRIGNISQLNASFEQELAKAANSSASAQQKILQCKQEQLAALEKIDKLTQYDIDRAKAKLSLTLKQIALEEARENKSKLRLKRDSQGNYSYQYSADREAIEKAKEEYEQARLKLNEDDQKNLQNAIDKMASLEKEAQESLSKLYEDLSKARTQEEKDKIQREFNQTLDYYDRQRRNRKQDVDRARTYLEGSDSGLGYYNQKMGTNYSSAKEAINKDKDGFYEFLYGSEGAVPLTDAAYQMMNQSTDDWRKEVKKAVEKGETAYEKYSSSVSDIANSVNNSLRSIIEGTSNHTGLINTKKYTDELNKSVENSAAKYRKANKAISTNIKRSGKLFKTLNSEAAKQAIKKPAQLANHLVNAKANVKALYNYINDNKDLAIKPMDEMSEAAKTLKKNWEGVYRAAKKAISATNDSGSGGSSSSGTDSEEDYTTSNTTTNNNNKKSNRKKIKYRGTTLYKKGKKYYIAATGGQAYSSKQAAKAAKTIAIQKSKEKIDSSDIGKKISLNLVGQNAAKKNPKGRINSYTWAYNPDTKKGKWKVLKNTNTLKSIAKKNNYIKKISSGGQKVLLGSKKGKNLGWFNIKTIQKYFTGFDTGGYTGSWNNTNGKLAMLHEKEIVLNKKDTANFLEAVKLTRSFAQDLGKYKNNLANQISALSNSTKVVNNQDNLQKLMQQEVNINATFPNATDRTEIEAAFKQLSDKAIQYAWSDKIK